MASQQQPLWLKLIVKVERTIGEQVEKAVHSDAYFDVMAEATRNRRRIVDTVEGVSKRCLHLLNIPAGTDVRRVRAQLNRIERQLTDVSKDIDDLQAAARRSPVT